MKNIILNKQQKVAGEMLLRWLKKQEKQIFTIVGPPGTGKTTIIRSIMEDTGLKPENILYTAFVGRAAQNMVIKGLNARTIHSTIYETDEIPVYDEFGEPVFDMGEPVTRIGFVKKQKLDEDVKLIVVDEGGTVDRILGAGLVSFGLPILVLGDLDQLPPIFGKSYFLHNPDVVLTEYMRQAEDSEIIYISKMINEFKDVPYGKYGNSYVIPKSEMTIEHAKSVDMCISTLNKTRQQFNESLRRESVGLEVDDLITIGDKVVCRNNDRNQIITDLSLPGVDIYIVNGMIGHVTDVHLGSLTKSTVNINLKPDFLKDKSFTNVPINLEFFRKPVHQKLDKRIYETQVELGHCISSYMSQGSEYDSILYYDDAYGNRESRRAHAFTAITRAKGSFIYVK